MKAVLLLLSALTLGFFSYSQKYSKVKIFTDANGLQQLANEGIPVDHGVWKENTFFISDFSDVELNKIHEMGFQTEILIDDVVQYFLDANHSELTGETRNATCSGSGSSVSGAFEPETPTNFNLGTMGGYLKYNEMLAELDQMAALYPNLITVKAPISTFLTHQNRPIYVVKISDNPNSDESAEPKVLYTAIHHAREPMSLMETIFFMWYLLENYDSNEEVQYLVNNMQLFFVPCINPDGYVHNENTNPNGGGMWRKNRRNNGGSFGVDLNRNYSYGWGTTGTSTNPSNDTYCGPSPFSEPETQAMRWLVQNHRFVTAFNAHTYAEDILFPIGTTTAEFADHHDYFQDECDHMVRYNGYTAMKSSGLYPASGDSDDYMYKVDIGVGQKDTMFVHTPEVGTAFWQPSAEIVPTCAEMVFPNLVLAHLTRKYLVVEDTDPSNVATMTGNFNHSAQRLGLEDGPVTVSIQPIQNIISVGAPIVYNLNIRQTASGAISYTLDPSIQFGDEIIYVLLTNNGLWTRRDTIVKTYGVLTLQTLENGSTANWTGNWNTTTSTFVSPSTSYTDTPTGSYANNANRTYTYVPNVDLTNATAAMVSFYARWNVEADYDFVQFQVSTDGGITWIGQCGNYTVPGSSANGSVQPNGEPVYEGVQTSWVLEEINLSDYLGQVIKFRFQLRADGGVTADGFYFDDFKIMFNEAEPPTPPTADFTVVENTICAGESVAFTDFSTGIPSSWSWDFGDGNSSTQQSPVHTYATAGTYSVSLTVSNSEGSNTLTETNLIIVNELPTVAISSSDPDNTICDDGSESIALTAVPSSAVISGPNVSGGVFSSTTPGDYTVTASFTDANGCEGVATIILTVESCSINSLNENESMKIIVQPNPNEGTFTVIGADMNSTIVVYDPNGRVVFSSDYLGVDSKIELKNVSAGLYYLQATRNAKPIRVKISVL
jgi:carboxypeptidase T